MKAIILAALASALPGFPWKFRPTGYSWAARSRSKYNPHQGKKEISRRARQIATGKLQVS